MPDRGIFDKEPGTEPLAILADALSVSLYMDFEWQFRHVVITRFR